MRDLEQKAAPAGKAMKLLEQYNYPGNIRELKYIIELAALKAVDGHIYPEHLPEQLLSMREENADQVNVDARFAADGEQHDGISAGLRRKNDAAILGTDTRHVLDTLQSCRGNRRAAARELGISERKIYRLLKRYEEMGLAVPRPYQ
jgi:two-component system response regulator FlrC